MNLPSIVQEGKTFLEKHGYIYEKSLLRGFLFVNKIENQAIVLDFDICNCGKPFHYVQYTKEQNLLMSSFDCLYRFVVDTEKDLIEFVADFNIIASQRFDENGIKFSGANRSLIEIDPSVPEAYFEQAFMDIYGNEALDSVLREEPFIDMNSQTRYIDYLIGTQNGKIAIEKNGELYHHPILIGKERYKKQLVKQNSIVANNIKIFRWSLEGMKAKDSFYEELINIVGEKDNLVRVHKLNVTRKIKLFSHQEITINTIAKERESGGTNFLVVLPTGTGKTEIYIADMINEIKKGTVNKILVLVPQLSVRIQTINRIKIRLSEEGINKSIGNSLGCDIVVVTNSFISRRHYELEQQHFDYIVVDEAHHSVAPTLSRVIQYFTPKTLIGLTATDKRLDEKKLEDIFGKYEVAMSLKEAIETDILAPIKVFRVESNIDLSEVRFNGKDYVGTDLQRTLIVPSRDKLIVDVLNKYFSSNVNVYKSGIIFCVSIKHAENLAKLMKVANFTCEAVSGSNQKSENYINEYQNGKI
jgi:hypothetical protein